MITQTIRRSETIIGIAAGVALVASKSEPGRWHTVRPGACSCKGFLHRAKCRHIAVAFPAVDACEHCGALVHLVTESRFIAGVGQFEETRCRDLLGCDDRIAMKNAPQIPDPEDEPEPPFPAAPVTPWSKEWAADRADARRVGR
jgi:hypothetical protein